MSDNTQQLSKFLDALKAKGFFAQYFGDEPGVLIPSCYTPDVVATIQKIGDARIRFADVNDSEVGFVDLEDGLGMYSEAEGTENFQAAVALALEELIK